MDDYGTMSLQERHEAMAQDLVRLRLDLVEARAERGALKDAAKTLQRVQFILGGHSGTIADCDEDALRENVERALSLMRKTLPPIVVALEARHEMSKV